MSNKQEPNIHMLLPSMGEGVSEATIVRWLKQEGDQINQGDPLVEVSTDKVDTEVCASLSGFLIKTFYSEGNVVQVGEALAQISDDINASIVNPTAQKIFSNTKEKQSYKNTQDYEKKESITYHNLASYAGRIKTSPFVRKLAKEKKIDLHSVIGTGKYGKITKDDIYLFLKNNHTSHEEKMTPRSKNIETKALKTELKDGDEYLEGVKIKREKMSKVRLLTAKHMSHSVAISPHATTTFAVKLNKIIDFKNKYSDSFQQKHKVKLSYTPFFISAARNALIQFPILNSSVDEEDILYKEDVNISCAVASKKGLFVPVLKKLNSDSFVQIIEKLQSLIKKTHEQKLNPNDIVGGTFTITNPGMYGCLHSQPIINQPQVAIMSIGQIYKVCEFENEKICENSYSQIGLTFDHRVIDGENAALFLQAVKKHLENFSFEEASI